ncbi:cupin domain-containing protein [Mycobacterium ostraviense]|uniref:cupin domain-containing protein n=1 Tax=Mycobacterium ostraviense TaxID=2738409 RepID=UPI002FCDF9AF
MAHPDQQADQHPATAILADTKDTNDYAAPTDVTGAAWKLEVRERDLDSNIVALPPDGGIGMHTGPDLDVLIHVLSGSGRLSTEEGTINLHPGALLWLPRRSRRQFTAGPEGLRYLTVHQRRQALALESAVPQGS